LAIYEILWQEKVDEKVAINEAVEMASELSTIDSSRYINGVLGRIVAIKSSLI
jgi:N utilization substance protein B